MWRYTWYTDYSIIPKFSPTYPRTTNNIVYVPAVPFSVTFPQYTPCGNTGALSLMSFRFTWTSAYPTRPSPPSSCANTVNLHCGRPFGWSLSNGCANATKTKYYIIVLFFSGRSRISAPRSATLPWGRISRRTCDWCRIYCWPDCRDRFPVPWGNIRCSADGPCRRRWPLPILLYTVHELELGGRWHFRSASRKIFYWVV